MMAFTVVLFSTLATSFVNASPIPFSHAVPSATTIEAGLPPIYAPHGSPVHSTIFEVHDHSEDPSDNVPPYHSTPGFVKLPLSESGTVSGSGSSTDHQRLTSGRGLNAGAEAESAAQQYRTSHGLDAKAEAESAAHYQQYRTSHGLEAADSDRIEKEEGGECDNDGQNSWDLGYHSHLRHQTGEGSDCRIAGSGVLCRVKQDTGPMQNYEASLAEPDIPIHIANID